MIENAFAVTWRVVPKSIVGPWTVNYYPGEEVVWWNAKGEDVKAPQIAELPTTIGETVAIPAATKEWRPVAAVGRL